VKKNQRVLVTKRWKRLKKEYLADLFNDIDWDKIAEYEEEEE